jgi:hypothetical protein
VSAPSDRSHPARRDAELAGRGIDYAALAAAGGVDPDHEEEEES